MRISDRPGWSVTPLNSALPRIIRLNAEPGLPGPIEIEPGDESTLVAINTHAETVAVLDVCDGEGDRRAVLLPPGFLVVVEAPAKIACNAASGFDALLMTIPAHFLGAFSSSEGLPRIATLACQDPQHDPVVHHLARALLHAFAKGRTPNPAFTAQFTRSLLARLAEQYGRPAALEPRFTGGLNPTNRRRVEERLKSPHDILVSASDLAQECRLSAGHFARAFRQTFGASVHQCLLNKRIDIARDLLRCSPDTLSHIATRTGFADQATFTESFSRIVGTSPGRYRRQTAN